MINVRNALHYPGKILLIQIWQKNYHHKIWYLFCHNKPIMKLFLISIYQTKEKFYTKTSRYIYNLTRQGLYFYAKWKFICNNLTALSHLLLNIERKMSIFILTLQDILLMANAKRRYSKTPNVALLNIKVESRN